MSPYLDLLSPIATSIALAPTLDSQQLWNRYHLTGQGSDAENDLVVHHLPLVKTVVGRLALSLPAHVLLEDLYSAGLVGLLDAVRRFDPANGSPFESYARVRIRGAVFDELRRLDWVPRSVHDKARKVQIVMNDLEQRQSRVPTDTEMARALNLSPDDYLELLDEIRPTTFICLDSVRGNEPGSSAPIGESLPDATQPHPGDHTADRELARLITDRLEALPEMQRKVLALYYFEDLRLREIAELFGLTESRICQIHAQAILAIRSYLHRADPSILCPSTPT
jgi:RNA polymerase sigma factor FliA